MIILILNFSMQIASDYIPGIKYSAWEVWAPKDIWFSASICAEAPNVVM